MTSLVDRLSHQISGARLLRCASLIILLLAGLGAVGTSAWAYWTSQGNGTASAFTGTLNAPTGTTVPATNNTGSVPVSWTAPTGTSPTGYYVTRIRNSDGSTAPACGSTPATLVTSPCVDPSVPDGTYRYSVTAVRYGWTATSTTSSAVLVDTVKPVVSLNAPSSPTNVNKPALSGIAGKQVADATHSADTLSVTVSITGGPTSGAGGVAAVNATTGAWSYTPTVALADGTYTVSVTQSDAAGNAATPALGTVLIDTVKPVVVLNAPTSPTNVNKPALSGTAGTQVADATHSADTLSVTVSITGGPTSGAGGVAAVNSATGAWSYTPTVALADGTYTVSVTQSDGAGNTATPAVGTVLIDTVKPTLTSISRVGLSSTVNSGPLAWTVTFSEPVNGLTVANFALVTSGTGGTAPTLTTVVPTGGSPATTWTVSSAETGTTGTNNGSIGLNLVNGTNVQDVAKNASATSSFTGPAFTYDTTPPAVTVTAIENRGGNSKIGARGTAQNGDGLVTVYFCQVSACNLANAKQTLTASVSNGSWSTGDSGNNGGGNWYATAVQTDAAGNTGTSSTFGPFNR